MFHKPDVLFREERSIYIRGTKHICRRRSKRCKRSKRGKRGNRAKGAISVATREQVLMR